jgi:hypothetical protein
MIESMNVTVPDAAHDVGGAHEQALHPRVSSTPS